MSGKSGIETTVIGCEMIGCFGTACLCAFVAFSVQGLARAALMLAAMICSGFCCRILAVLRRSSDEAWAERMGFLQNPELSRALFELRAWRGSCLLPGKIVVGYCQSIGSGQYNLHVNVFVDLWNGDTPVSVMGMPFELWKAKVPSTIQGLTVAVSPLPWLAGNS